MVSRAAITHLGHMVNMASLDKVSLHVGLKIVGWITMDRNYTRWSKMDDQWVTSRAFKDG